MLLSNHVASCSRPPEKSFSPQFKNLGFMFLGQKLRNNRQITSEDFFFEVIRFLRQKLNFVQRMGRQVTLGWKVGHDMKKVENHCTKP